MNIDERLDRLTERHEALTQAVEIIAGMQKKNEEAHQKNEVLIEKIQGMLGQIVESIEGLVRIARGHERRISGLEEGRP
jgi:uncharacterized spore protein YtfJ